MEGEGEWGHGVVGTISPAPITDHERPCHLHCSSDGKRIIYGCPTGVVIRCLPEQFDGKFPVVSIYTGVKKPLKTAGASPDGVYVAGGDTDGNIYIWTHAPNGLQMACYGTGMQYVKLCDLSFSHDSRRLAICGIDKYVKKLATCIIVAAGNPVGRIEGHTLGINSISFRQQKPHRIATAGVDGNVAFHEGPPFKLLLSERPHAGEVYCCRYSPDGSLLATCGQSGELCFWHPTSGEFDRRVTLSRAALFSVAWAECGALLAVVGADREVRIFDVNDDKVVLQFSLGDDIKRTPVGVCWAVNKWLCVLTADGTISGFALNLQGDPNAPPARVIFRWIGPKGIPCALGHNHRTDQLVCGTNNGNLIFLTKQASHIHACQMLQLPSSTTIKSILIGKKSGFCVTMDGHIRQFLLPESSDHTTTSSMALPDNEADMTAAARRKSAVRFVPKGETLKKQKREPDKTFVRTFTRFADGSSTPLLDVDKDIEIIACHQFDGAGVGVAALGGDEKCCAVVCTNGVILAYPWTMKGRSKFEPLWNLKLKGIASVTSLAHTPDGTIIAVGVVAGADYPSEGRSFGEGISKVVSRGDIFVEIYECVDPMSSDGIKHIWNFDCHKDEISAIAISPDGIFLATADTKKSIVVLDLRDGKQVISNEWSFHTTKVTTLDWSPDGTKLASGSVDRSIFVWDIDRPTKKLQIKDAHYGGVTSVRFLHNHVIASVGSDGLLQVFEVWFG